MALVPSKPGWTERLRGQKPFLRSLLSWPILAMAIISGSTAVAVWLFAPRNYSLPYETFILLLLIVLRERIRGLDREKNVIAAHRALHLSEILYKEIAETASDMIVRCSLPDLKCIYVSPACERLLGFSPEDLVGVHVFQNIHADDKARIEVLVADIFSGNSQIPLAPIEYRTRTRAGQWVWVEASPNFTRDPEGGVNGLICSIRGVEARRRAEAARVASELRFRLLAENASELIVLAHEDGRRSYISPGSLRLAGFTPAELEGEMHTHKWLHPDDVDYLASVDLASDGADTTVRCRVRHKNGSWIWVEAIFRRIPSCAEGEPVVIATFRDITESRAQAEALREAKEAADAARCAAEQASHAKSDFLATMSHEIRTPLNAILGFSDLLNADKTLQPSSRRCLDRIQSAGSALRTLVDDILDFSKLESGEICLRSAPFDLTRLIHDAVSIVRGLAGKKQLHFEVDVDATIPTLLVGDCERLRQVLLNLLNNAVKFTRQGRIKLELEALSISSDDAALRFCVTDTGIGISADKISTIFQRFSQVDGSSSREYGGTGLGLAICRSLVEAMGGRIGVDSVVEQGSSFWFELSMPIADAATGNVERQEPSTEAHDPGLFDELLSVVGLSSAGPTPFVAKPDPVGRPHRALDILLVEDVALNQELMCALLEARGHEVDLVGNGSEAIMAVDDKVYDVVFMDLQMPHVDGLAATRVIRNLASADRRFVPIVALTAAVLRAQTDAALAAGMNAVLTKPFSTADLDLVLQKAARDELRDPVDLSALDIGIAQKLVGEVGEAKVRSMRMLLQQTLAARFTSSLSDESEAALKDDAHASISGAAMLGFTRFAKICRSFLEATAPEEMGERYGALRRELYHVVRTLQTLDASARSRQSVEAA